MRRLYPIIIVFLSLVLGCGTEDDKIISPLIDRYHINYMDLKAGNQWFPRITPQIFGNYYGDRDTLLIVKLEYQRGQVIRKIGEVQTMYPATGYSNFFTPEHYDSVSYKGRNIFVTRKTTSRDFIVPSYQRTIIRNAAGYPVQKIYSLDDEDQDSTTYYYNSKGKLIQSIHHNDGNETVRNYSYLNDNMVHLEIIMSRFGSFFAKQVEVYEDYDQAVNPFQQLWLFDELLVRSLSKNNYRTIRYFSFTPEGDSTEFLKRWFTFEYNEQGIPNFGVKRK